MLAGAVALAVTSALLASDIVNDNGSSASFSAAQPCASGQDPTTEPCLGTIAGKVTDVSTTTGSGGAETVALAVSADGRAWNFSVDFGSSADDNLTFVAAGDAATLELWRGVVISVTAGGATDATAQAPGTGLRGSMVELPISLAGMLTLLLLPAYVVVRARVGSLAAAGDPPQYPERARRLVRWVLCDIGLVLVAGVVAGSMAPLDQGGTVALVAILFALAGAVILARATLLAFSATSPDAPTDPVSSAWR